MSKNQKKLAVLSELEKCNEAIQLPDLMKRLHLNYSERTVRRWLNELVDQGRVEKTGQRRGTKYRVLKNISATDLASAQHCLFSRDAQTILQHIKKPLFQRNPVTYNKVWIDAYQPNQTFYLSVDQRNALKKSGKPEYDETPAGTVARKIYNRLLIDLSYNSSRLEGNTYTIGETEKLIIEGIDSAGKLNSEKIMILNHKEAIRYLVDNAIKLEINVDTICTIHYLLSDGLVLPKYTGKMRDHSVKISRSTYLPMDDQLRLSKQLSHICDIASKIKDSHEQSFFLLVHIAYLQAFTDVNKRTSRLSANIPLIQHNLYPISFNKVDKDDYISALIAVYELNDVRALAQLYTFSSLYTAKEYNVIVDSAGFNETRIRFRTVIRNIIRDVILKKMVGNELQNYIKNAVLKTVSKTFQSECLKIINEDIRLIGPERIHGLGITKKELGEWIKRQ